MPATCGDAEVPSKFSIAVRRYAARHVDAGVMDVRLDGCCAEGRRTALEKSAMTLLMSNAPAEARDMKAWRTGAAGSPARCYR